MFGIIKSIQHRELSKSRGVRYTYCKLSINNSQYHHQFITNIFNLTSSVSAFLCIMNYCNQQRKLLCIQYFFREQQRDFSRHLRKKKSAFPCLLRNNLSTQRRSTLFLFYYSKKIDLIVFLYRKTK